MPRDIASSGMSKTFAADKSAASLLDELFQRPAFLFQFAHGNLHFQDRFPLVVEELLGMPKDPMIVAEGFGFTPELLSPLLPSSRQAIWLVPTEEFKRASMERRNKPSFKDKVSDPERATRNLFLRDMLLAKQVKLQAQSFGMTVYEIDGALPVEQIAALVEQHFKPLFYEASEPGKCNDIA